MFFRAPVISLIMVLENDGVHFEALPLNPIQSTPLQGSPSVLVSYLYLASRLCRRQLTPQVLPLGASVGGPGG